MIFHLGDETLIERHGRVENGKLVIGKRQYSIVITECCDVVLPTTEKLINEFINAGGEILTVDDVAVNNIVDREDITYTIRQYDDFKLHYFVNTSPDRKNAKINVNGFAVDIYSGEFCGFDANHSFEPWGSLLVVESDELGKMTECESEHIKLNGDFEIISSTHNCLKLDCCDYYFDGVLQEEHGYVLNICERAINPKKKIALHQDYKVKFNYIPNVLYLVCETPEKFVIKVNGKVVLQEICGYFADASFKKIDISKYVRIGDNVISFDCDFVQSDEFYKNLEKANVFESEKNKLTYDMEIEAVYLVGDFSVKTGGEWENLDRNSVRYKGGFEIDAPVSKICLKDIEKQGFPFFAGKILLSGEITCNSDNTTLWLDMTGVNAVRVKIDDFDKTILTDDHVNLDVEKGRHKIELTLTNTLRNMLGPHHLEMGESHLVTPGSFYKEDCIWSGWGSGAWNENYCFVKMGLK